MLDREQLIAALAHWLAAGKLDAGFVVPALEVLRGEQGEPESLLAVLDGLEGPDEALRLLRRHIRERLRAEALRAYEQRRQGERIGQDTAAVLGGLSLEAAPEWRFGGDPTAVVETALRLSR